MTTAPTTRVIQMTLRPNKRRLRSANQVTTRNHANVPITIPAIHATPCLRDTALA